MNKFEHKILKEELTKTGIKYYFSKDLSISIDILSPTLFRFYLNKSEESLKTYAICPNKITNLEGRDRNSIEGFKLSPFSYKDDAILFGKYKIIVNKENFSLKVLENDKLLYEDRQTQCYDFYGEIGGGSKHYISFGENEKNFGLGDKAGLIDRTGNSFDFYCIDAMGFDAKSTDPLYKHIPFYITKVKNGYYGIFYDTHQDAKISFRKELDNYHGQYKYFESEDQTLCYYVLLGDLKSIVSEFSSITGGAKFFPKWTLDYAGSTMAYTDKENSDELLENLLEECKDKSFNMKAFYLSSGYTSIGKYRHTFNWNRSKFKDPNALSKKYLDNGTRFIANIKPCFLINHPNYEEMAAKGLFLKNEDGTPALSQFWDSLGSYIDFTNPDAYKYWKEKVKEQLLDKGISCTWNDNNEYEVWDKNVLCFNFGHPTKAYKLKPVFSYLMQMASLEAQEEVFGERQFMSVRSCGAGLNRFSQTWSGDNLTCFDSLRFNNKQGLSMSLSGIFNYGHDVGGFAGPLPSCELFLRWIQNGIFTPRFVIHSWNQDGTVTLPWVYEDVQDNIREMFKLRFKLIPYLYTQTYLSCQNNTPITAPLFYYYNYEDVESDLFMFGDSILVANIFDEGKKHVDALLPAEEDWYYGDTFIKGGSKVTIENSYKDLPVYFIKAGSVIPTNEVEYKFNQNDENIVFNIYAKESGESESFFFNDDGLTNKYEQGDCIKLEIKVEYNKESVKVYYSNLCNNFTPSFKLIDTYNRPLEVIEK